MFVREMWCASMGFRRYFNRRECWERKFSASPFAILREKLGQFDTTQHLFKWNWMNIARTNPLLHCVLYILGFQCKRWTVRWEKSNSIDQHRMNRRERRNDHAWKKATKTCRVRLMFAHNLCFDSAYLTHLRALLSLSFSFSVIGALCNALRP